MGKGGCAHPAEADGNESWLGLKSIASAVSVITGNKWAEGSMSGKTGTTRKAAGIRERRDQPISWDEIRSHTSADSCWMVVKAKVYDVTEFAPHHPGGPAIYAYAGRDATDVFSAFHDSSTWAKLEDFCVGRVELTEPDAMLKDFRKLRAQMIRAGLYNSSKSFYAWKVLSLLGMYFTAAAILMHGEGSWLACFSSSFLLALAWQQSGWLAHDFLHHQVFGERFMNNVFGYLIGNFLQGFSVDWWKSKHNTHHAAPNECTMDAAAVDPDIDTLPLLAWHEDMVQNLDPSTARLLRVQQYLFFPLLCFARLTWAQQSFAHARLLSTISRSGSIEVALIVLHYATFLGLPLATLGFVQGSIFFMLAQILAGFMLALVFVQSHNGMEVYMGGKDFVSAQLVSTRNITSTLFMDWFTGGLNYQIEHHLFPTMPRHNLRAAQPLVKQFCREHGFMYESCGMDTGTYRVLERLAEIAAKVPIS
eukprot:jgi/Ulvmu1/5368/UM022_0162.1